MEKNWDFKMEPEPSQAAISAIAALQHRIRELEDEEEKLKAENERYKLLVDENEDVRLFREQKMKEMFEKGEEMMMYVQKITQDKEDARNENRRLRKELLTFEKTFPFMASYKPGQKIKLNLKQQRYLNDGPLRDYRILLKEIISPKPLGVSKEILNFTIASMQ